MMQSTGRTPSIRLVRVLVALMLGALLVWAFPTGAQEPIMPAEPADAASGLLTFAARCANCHGPQGLGDGELAPDLPVAPKPIGTAGYQYTAIPVETFNTIQTGIVQSGMPPFGPASSNPLTDREIWDVVAGLYSLSVSAESLERGAALAAENELSDRLNAVEWATNSNQMVVESLSDTGLDEGDLRDIVNFGRTATYNYVDAAALNAPLESAAIAGTIINQTTGDLIAAGDVELRVFSQFELIDRFSTSLDGGQYRFELSNIDPNHIFVVSYTHEGVNYNSDFVRLNAAEPEQNVPLSVFETTTDPAVVAVDELRMFVEFLPDDVMRVSEFYLFGNNSDRAFAGVDGDPQSGTVEIQLPAGAENVEFARSFGSEFVPAEDIIQSELGWRDTQALFPGAFASGLLVTYELPYEDGITLAHPLVYPLGGATLFMPDNGVAVVEDGNWQATDNAQAQGAAFLTYAGQANDGALLLALSGRPTTISDPAAGGQVAVRDASAELVFGLGLLLVVIAVALVFIQRWQKQPIATTRDGLVQRIAELDDTYARGDISRNAYEKERRALKKRLRKEW